MSHGYGNHLYLLPGDMVKSTVETFNFHRDMNYKVSKCFKLNGKLIVYVENKWGEDSRYIPANFEYTSKTVTADEKRRRECMLINLWMHSNDSFEVFHRWDNSVKPAFNKHFPISTNLFLVSW
jgi:hypothetical protein